MITFVRKKYFNKKFIISVRYRITKVFGFYENYHYLNIFKTKPEQNMHQNVPNDTIFTPQNKCTEIIIISI